MLTTPSDAFTLASTLHGSALLCSPLHPLHFSVCRYGDVQAKYLLGTWLCEGRGGGGGPGTAGFHRGLSLQVEAATAGHARATYNIGVFYMEGSEGGVEKDLAAAAVWFEKASALGG